MTKKRFLEIKELLKEVTEKEIKDYLSFNSSVCKKVYTINYHLKRILTPEQYENAKKCKRVDVDWDMLVADGNEAVIHGFSWECMPEGHDYWYNKWWDYTVK